MTIVVERKTGVDRQQKVDGYAECDLGAMQTTFSHFIPNVDEEKIEFWLLYQADKSWAG